ncbi:hypothetical protein J1N35_005642 [Gossypium stocksii]|uniref:Uncharacterized protein n=1 Tax=Gossypium stocksii TaxID=47602 RepID=A0A9D3WF18_9ROSI|nr:hypothetical protein J1N35_005642 [Gossypium stocksii]
MESTDDIQERPLESNNEPELEEVVAPTVELEIETIKDFAIANIPCPLRLGA